MVSTLATILEIKRFKIFPGSLWWPCLILSCIKFLTQVFSWIDVSTTHLQKGLRKEEQQTSSVKCFPTYVRSLPNGKEHGKFLSLDLGGTNFRVIVMELTPNQEFLMDNKIYSIPHEVMTGIQKFCQILCVKCVQSFFRGLDFRLD